MRDEAVKRRTADPEFSHSSPHCGWIKTCFTFGENSADHVGPVPGERPSVTVGLRSNVVFGDKPASNLARRTVPYFVQSGNGRFRSSSNQLCILIERTG
jgi:hypothetical protein